MVENSNMVFRRRLMDRLDAASPGSVILVSAPAGYGKTSLVAAWIQRLETPCGWYSIDESDNDPGRFFGYLVAALQTVEQELAVGLTGTLEAPESPDMVGLMASLVNELAGLDQNLVLVLDDIHVLDNASIVSSLAFLVKNLPRPVRLVLTTREDPAIPLSRLRARGRLTEIRAADLCFTDQEAVDFLNGKMSLALQAPAVATLNGRTEGWIAGLQMAALSLSGRDDIEGFLEDFSGTHRFIVDFLVDEVLDRQPDYIRDFLLATSILDRLTAPLCDAVTETRRSRELLNELELRNMLLVPLDDRREWYRYHQLFADVLRTHALRDRGSEVSRWHSRASRWHEENGDRKAAIAHAFSSGDSDLAADILERTWPELAYGIRPMAWLAWAQRIPASVIAARPVLSAACAWMLLDKGDLALAEKHLLAVERTLKAIQTRPSESTAASVANPSEFRTLPGSTEAAWAYVDLLRGDSGGAIEHAEKARELLSEEDHFWHGTASLFSGLAHWFSGNLEVAYRTVTESVRHQRAAGNRFYEAFGMVICADIRMAQGRLRDAHTEYERIVAAGTAPTESERGRQLIQDPVALHAGLGELYRRWGDLETAEEHLHRGFEIRARAVLPATAYRLSSARGRLRESRRDYDGALADFDEAERLFKPGALPDPFPYDVNRIRVSVRQGRLREASDWAQNAFSASTQAKEIPFLREFEYLTWARVRIAVAESKGDDASLRESLRLLRGLVELSIVSGRIGTVVEAGILEAIAFEALGQRDSAVGALHRALGIAEPEGLIQPFVDESDAIESLLVQEIAGQKNPGFTRSIIQRIRTGSSELISASDANRLLVEPLSGRELEVLGLLNEGNSNQEIADKLFVALSTAKKHLNSIFGKMAVKSRTEALRRARELGLL